MSFSERDLQALAALLREAARREIMPRFRRLGAGAVRQKAGPLDLVTDADEAAEAMIEAALRRRFPGCLVVGEEAAARAPDLLAGIGDAALSFVVDPVDGTANYAAGLPLFGTMAAAIIEGEVVAAAIHDPVGDDTALALRGEGAWMQTSDGERRPLAVAAPAPVARMTGAASYRYLPEPLRSAVCRNLPRVAATWDYRCGAHEYRLAAAGHCHFLLFNRLMPWDHAPGWLLHREAGGFSAQFDGTPYRPGVTSGGLLCAPDEAGWLALRAALLEMR
ncbi:MAG: inositol monophosphatase [Acidisphaera sp.]|nr:inositol monophosphatase [Acidisphaera sp.]